MSKPVAPEATKDAATIHAEIKERLKILKPLLPEYERLLKAEQALGGLDTPQNGQGKPRAARKRRSKR